MQQKEYDVVVKLVKAQQPCNMGHQIGDQWVFGMKTPEGMCSSAYSAVYAHALVLKFGGTFPWQPEPDVMEIACPDGDAVNIFEIKRTLKK